MITEPGNKGSDCPGTCATPLPERDALSRITRLKEVENEIRATLSSEKFATLPYVDWDELFLISLNIDENEHIDETLIKNYFTKTFSKYVCKIIAKYIIQETKHTIPAWMTTGTPFKNITNLDAAGIAQFPKESEGYLRLENLASLEDEIEKDPTNKDLSEWKRIIYERIIKPRSHDFWEVYLILVLKYLNYDSISPFLCEASAIIDELMVELYFPWSKPKSKFFPNSISNRAKIAPIMLGAYFCDMFKHELDLRIGQLQDIDLNRMLETKRIMLSRGYFKAILELKSIKDIAVAKIAPNGTVYQCVDVGLDCSVNGINQKKAYNLVSVYEDTMKKLEPYPYAIELLEKLRPGNTTDLIRNVASLLAFAASSAFIWTDLPIVGQLSQWSRVGHDYTTLQPKERDLITGQVYSYHVNTEIDALKHINSLISLAQPVDDISDSFISALTSNSAGNLPPEISSAVLNLDPVYKTLGSSKIGALAVAPEILNNIDMLQKGIAEPTAVFFREQIYRRPRLVAGVSIANQLAYHPGNLIGKEIAASTPSYMTGKNRGTVQDARLQLNATGNSTMFASYLDVTGFDSSDPISLQDFCEAKMHEVYRSYDETHSPGYFALTPQTRIVEEFSPSGQLLGTKEIKISSVNSARLLASNKPSLPKIRGDRHIALSSDTLRSGAYDTTAKGTLVTAGVAESVRSNFQKLSPSGAASGDDFQMVFHENKGVEIDAAEVNDWLTDQFGALGFKVEAATSNVFSEFLQMGALLGCSLSYNHRLTPFTAENYESRHPFENYGSTFGIYHEMYGRCHFPDELTRIMHATCYFSSFLKVDRSIQDPTKRQFASSFWVKVPNCAMFLRYNVPFPGLVKYSVSPSSNYTLGGDTKKLELFLLMYGFTDRSDESFNNWVVREQTINFFRKRFPSMPSDAERIEAAKQLFLSGKLFDNVYNRIRLDICPYIQMARTLIWGGINTSIDINAHKIPETDRDKINFLADVVNKLQNPSKTNKSEVAFQSLLADGRVQVPEVLVYSRRNRFKLQGVYLSKIRDDKYWAAIDFEIARMYNEANKKSIRALFHPFPILFDVNVQILDDVQVHTGILGEVLKRVPLAPYSMFSYDGTFSLLRRGESSTDMESDIAKLDRSVSMDFLTTNLEAWKRIINTLAQIGSVELVTLTGEAIGLRERELTTLQSLVFSRTQATTGVFHISYNGKSQFWMSTNALSIVERTSIRSVTFKSRFHHQSATALAVMLESIIGPELGLKQLKYTYPINWMLAVSQNARLV